MHETKRNEIKKAVYSVLFNDGESVLTCLKVKWIAVVKGIGAAVVACHVGDVAGRTWSCTTEATHHTIIVVADVARVVVAATAATGERWTQIGKRIIVHWLWLFDECRIQLRSSVHGWLLLLLLRWWHIPLLL